MLEIATKIIEYVTDEWADAHFFFLKCLKEATSAKAPALDMRQTRPGGQVASLTYKLEING